MTANPLQNIQKLESDLWEAADNLRANSKLTSSEYCMPVLGIIFLRHATNRHDAALAQIQADQAAGRMPKRALVKADFLNRRALLLPPEARYDQIMKQKAGGAKLGKALVQAMNAIERDFEPLRGQLPREYEKFENSLLEDLLRVFDSEALRTATGDVFGRIYEYFLMKFAMQGAQDNGEFFTPPSLVQVIVNVIEPDRGVVADLACGSGGMFVQSSHFIEAHGKDTMGRVSFFGQEKTGTTIRLAKMNLAVHGLEGEIREANTFYEDVHRLSDGKRLWGHVDFLMANPPFNVDMVDAGKIKDDPRLPFGLPGVNKEKKVSNGNYLWISYFHSYLAPKGRAGFVMSSQASSAGHAEAEVRRKILETGDVDAMVSIRSNFFYTRTVPCELWFFDRGKPAARKDTVLMLDARNIYRKVTRKIYDFSPEQLQNLTAIVWLYRGETERFTALVQSYLDRTLTEAAGLAAPAKAFRAALEALGKATAAFLKTLPKNAPLHALATERDEAAASVQRNLDACSTRIAKDWKKPNEPKTAAQSKRLAELETLGTTCRELVKEVDLGVKLATRLVDTAEKDTGARDHDDWDTRAIGRLEKELDAHRRELVDALKRIAYFPKQAHWLLSRFPQATFVAVPGLCKAVTRADLAAADWSLTPGRYVGVAPAEVDEEFDFEQAMGDIHNELADLNAEAADLAAKIQKNFRELGA
jgi:type I restriction enzyme M protein